MEIIDLSHVIEDGMVTYPGLPGPSISDHLDRAASRSIYADGTEFHIGRIDLVANTGTYLDTPFHRFADGYDLSGLLLERIAHRPGVVVDAPAEGPVEPAALEGLDVQGRAVLLRTGWSRHWRTEEYGSTRHPFLDERGAALLVAAGAALVGIDSVNIDDTRGGNRPSHTTLLGAGIPIVEHLTALERLHGDFTFSAVPPAIRGMGTFPVRAFAVVGGP